MEEEAEDIQRPRSDDEPPALSTWRPFSQALIMAE